MEENNKVFVIGTSGGGEFIGIRESEVRGVEVVIFKDVFRVRMFQTKEGIGVALMDFCEYYEFNKYDWSFIRRASDQEAKEYLNKVSEEKARDAGIELATVIPTNFKGK